ncbi:MAG: hypothetical protein PHT99_03295, partial [Methanoregula sp.]|nr:hypothetical protein [Methanoregula sp.]
LNVSTFDGGLTSKSSAMTLTKLPKPAITSFAPSIAYRGTEVSFVLYGKYFQNGDRTSVTLTQPGKDDITITMISVYPTRINGYAVIPAGDTTGSWTANVTTLDGGTSLLASAVKVL